MIIFCLCKKNSMNIVEFTVNKKKSTSYKVLFIYLKKRMTFILHPLILHQKLV